MSDQQPSNTSMTQEYTVDWFTHNASACLQTLTSAGKRTSDPLHILEIGSFEGMSAVWFLQTFPHANMTCIDTFEGSTEHHEAHINMGDVETRFWNNIRPFTERVTVLRGHSSRMLYRLDPETFDCIYVDGSHTEADTLVDLVLAYGLLKPGGVLLVDDYQQNAFPGVRRAVDHVASVLPLELVYRHYQAHFIKQHDRPTT
jgi:predicted O-methyltransferase YrrM